MLIRLPKQKDSAPHNKTSNTISIQTESTTDSKLTESSKISKKNNTDRERERVKNGSKNITHIGPKQSTPLHKNADNASSKENADNNEDNSLINSCDINSKSNKSIVILGDSMLKHLNGHMGNVKKS